MDWYFKMTSDEYGTEEFGPYTTEEDAMEGMKRVSYRAAFQNDSVKRLFELPYQKEEA
jgi:hypothetical protein